MKYEEAIEYMESLSCDKSIRATDTFYRLCEKLDNPWQELSFIHIAAGDHKGSVAAYISAVLQAAGYKVGRYIPQTMWGFSGRLQIANRPITKKYFGQLTKRIQDICRELEDEGYPAISLYEAEAAMMFMCFKEHGVQAVVVETGLRSRIHPFNYFIEEWILNHCPSIEIETDSCAKKLKYGLKRQRFDYQEWKDLEISAPGVGRLESAICAVKVIESLQKQGYVITEKALRKGLLESSFMGDFTIVGKNPYFVMDPVHVMEESVKLAKSIETYFAGKNVIYVVGMLQSDKPEQIFAPLIPYAKCVITVPVQDKQESMSSYQLASELIKFNPNVTAVDSLEEAVEISYLLAEKSDVIIALGADVFLGRLGTILSVRNGQ